MLCFLNVSSHSETCEIKFGKKDSKTVRKVSVGSRVVAFLVKMQITSFDDFYETFYDRNYDLKEQTKIFGVQDKWINLENLSKFEKLNCAF